MEAGKLTQMEQKTCDVADCGRRHHAKGFCQWHYVNVWQNIDRGEAPVYCNPGPSVKREKLPCSFPPCERKAIAKGLCPAHYYQQRVALQPLTIVRKSILDDPSTWARYEGTDGYVNLRYKVNPPAKTCGHDVAR